MLTQDEIRALDDGLGRYPKKRSGTVDALKIVQRRRGWISNEVLRDLAEYLGMTAEELEEVATFYPLIFRRKVGRHVIRICDSVSCWIAGSEDIVRRLSETLGLQLGETTADGRFTLLPSACLGACDRAPALMIDDDLITDWNPADADRILARYP
jgi:NADH-quinone oxidoreductase subunit E